MRILITGGTGLLGKALIETADMNYEILATYLGNYDMKNTAQIRYKKLDIRDSTGHGLLFKDFRPTVVIHTAGVGSPDFAEKNKNESREINVGGTQNIIDNCKLFGARFIYISSNGIYDGENAPYSEDMQAEPINYYGTLKLEGEKITKESGVSYAIVRPILMYGWNYQFERPNIVTLAISKLKSGEQISAYDDVYSNPLFAQSCAQAIYKIIEDEKFEVFNIAGKDRVSIYELVKKTSEIFGFDVNSIIPIKQGMLGELVRRPKDTSYNTDKMRQALKLKPCAIAEGLAAMRNSKDYRV